MVTTACPECGAGVAPDARFCAACGAKLAAPNATQRETRKVVTVLFADVTGSTALGEQLDPEALRALMNRYFARMRIVIEAHGGTVEKFIGDAVMAVFGIPQVHEDDALRAVRAAAEIRDALAAMNEELEAERGLAIRFRTGVNTGEVVAGDPESGTTLVTGDAVNTAARLEQAAPPGEILLGRLTYSLVRDAVDAEPVDPIAAKGKAQAVEAYRLVAVRAGAEGHSRHLDAPLVGRERELERLTSAYRSAVADRSCTLFTLLGSAGVGKSRLAAEFLASVAGEATVLRGRCLSYGEGITYWPIGEIVRDAAGITEADDAEAARAKVRVLLDGEHEADDLADRVSAAIGLSVTQAPQDEVAWAVRRLLEHLAANRPLVVVIEDIHWAEQTLLELIEHVADWVRDAAILVLCPARPELLDEHPGWGGGKLNATTILLEPLAADAMGRLIEALPGGAALSAPVSERVAAAAEGNPLYVEELLAMLVDDGLLAVGPDGAWRASPGIEDVPVPPSISLLLAARLERLAPGERQVAERASVVGRVFEQAAVVELSGDDARPTVPGTLLALVRKELVRPERGDLLTTGLSFKFRHVLIRDAAYEALPKAERAVLHAQVADWLLRIAGDRLGEVEEIVGYHLAQAHAYRAELGESGPEVELLAARAADHLVAAGLRAEERRDAGTTATLLRHAIELSGAPTRRTDELRLRVARAMLGTGMLPEAVALDEEVRARAAAAGDGALEARATVAALTHRAALGTPGPTSEAFRILLEDTRAVVERIGDPVATSRYWSIVSTNAWNRGLWQESRSSLRTALAFAAQAGDPIDLQDLEVMEFIELMSGPTPFEVVLARSNEILGRTGLDRLTRADIQSRRGLIKAMLGMPDARDDVRAAIAAYLDLGARMSVSEGLWHRAWIERLDGRFEDEAACLRDSLVEAEPAFAPFLQAELALALAKLGRPAEARDAQALAAGDTWYRTVRLLALGGARLDAIDGRTDAALMAANDLERGVAEDTFFLNARSELLIECGVIAELAGDHETAIRRATMALESAEEKGSVAISAKARALLAGDLSRL